MLQISLLMMKSPNKNGDSHFLIRCVLFVSKGNLFDIYCYVCLVLYVIVITSKHRLWVHVRTDSARRFKRVPTIYGLKKIMFVA